MIEGELVELSETIRKVFQLELSRPADGVLQIVLQGHGRANALGAEIHREMAEIWRDVDADPATRVAVVRGPGDAFAAGATSTWSKCSARTGKDGWRMEGSARHRL